MYTVEQLVDKITATLTKVYHHIVMYPERIKHITYPNDERCLYPEPIEFSEYNIKLEVDPYDVTLSGAIVLEHKYNPDDVIVLNLDFDWYEHLAFLADHNLVPFYIENENDRTVYIGYLYLDEQNDQIVIYWHCVIQLPINTEENLIDYLCRIELGFDIVQLHNYMQDLDENETFMDLIDYKLDFSIDTESYTYEQIIVADPDENGNSDIRKFGTCMLNDTEWNIRLLDYVEYDHDKGYIPLIEKNSVVDIYDEKLDKFNERFGETN